MATSKSNIRIPTSNKNTAKKLIYANDTSGTMPSSRPKRAESTRILLEDYENSEQFLINESNSNNNDRLTTNGFDVWKWVIDHWEFIAALLTGIIITSVFITKLDTKVDTLSGDIKDVKATVEKLSTESTKSGQEVIQIQRSITRLENQRDQQKK